MRLTKKRVAAAAGVATSLAVVGFAVTPVAQAAQHTAVRSSVSSPPTSNDKESADAAKDADTLQQGDTTAPDAGAPQQTAGGNEPGTEATSGNESAGSDGNDGGHADPPGVDVNHEGGAGER